ncbi:AAA family ATPase [Pseudomonas sp. RIT357]|uniref:AAA family ATPase n=1 Tax=Pseudomonas sp. RIT357 TaxID=1470593 RepID=UPI000452F5CF|nr:AAA family ATPase [Pseudomonas sp. RIT357]EZP64207.1 hemin importer ATP-binding subunit [Pseudomonas sp. RIT357]
MKLNFERPFKSIRSLDALELPDFTVITGTNGAGKSHLLNALTEGTISIEGIEHHPQGPVTIKLFDANTLVPQDTGTSSSFQARQERDNIWSLLSELLENNRAELERYTAQHPKLALLKITDLLKINREDLRKYDIPELELDTIFSELKSNLSAIDQNLTNQFIIQNRDHYPNLVKLLVNNSSTPLIGFDADMFYDNYPISWQQVDIFQQSFAKIFSEYQGKLTENLVSEYRRNARGEDITALSEVEFYKRYGMPPWDFLNDIFETGNLPFRINKPHETEDRPYEPILTDTITNAKVKFNDLSSGERILMSFALCLYYTKGTEGRTNYPSVLLFDEIDAPLHPSMTKSLLDTIQTVLVNEQKIKVILTTHSPSTVALCPDEAVYVMNKEGPDRLKKASKDVALSLLLSGVPSISISYENRRQVFVESYLDAKYYDAILEKIKHRLLPEVSLSFIASKKSKTAAGGCEHVKTIVENLALHGNNTIKGLIDWDCNNTSTSHIEVLGENRRHSIENYILDPLLVALLLFQDKSIDREKLGLAKNETASDIIQMPDSRLQKIANYIIQQLKPHIDNLDSELIECKYSGGQKISIPRSYLTYRGHDLEKILITKIDGLKQYHKNGQLTEKVLFRIYDEFPKLIPLCFENTFKKLQLAV